MMLESDRDPAAVASPALLAAAREVISLARGTEDFQAEDEAALSDSALVETVRSIVGRLGAASRHRSPLERASLVVLVATQPRCARCGSGDYEDIGVEGCEFCGAVAGCTSCPSCCMIIDVGGLWSFLDLVRVRADKMYQSEAGESEDMLSAEDRQAWAPTAGALRNVAAWFDRVCGATPSSTTEQPETQERNE